MAATTALIFVGNPHPNDGGLRPLVTIQLVEGDRPAFTFPRLTGGKRNTPSQFVLIPSLENMLDDLLLVVAYRELQDPGIVKMLNSFCDKEIEQIGRLEIYGDLSTEQRLEIYNRVKEIENFPKIGVCLFEGSDLFNTVDHIKEYKMEFEVCTPSLTSFKRRL